VRLDSYLVQKGFFESRNRAKEAIKSALVEVNGKTITKSSFDVFHDDLISIKEHKFYISRAAKKLEEYLKEFALPLKDAIALDVGSSTGGFSQILLEHGVKEIDCVDVGSKQLHKSLRENPRVNVFEETDIREFHSDKNYDIIVSDVSFISLNLILDAIDKLATQNTIITLLFKPQFEVGKEVKRDSKGVVVDKKAIDKAKELFLANSYKLHWTLIDRRESKISGKEGNIEEFFTFKKETK
jgi:23S rRNA (cytidine1920-2'-O)/16S rRNA (cytidine1409-2'-O)-methyltransferase